MTDSGNQDSEAYFACEACDTPLSSRTERV